MQAQMCKVICCSLRLGRLPRLPSLYQHRMKVNIICLASLQIIVLEVVKSQNMLFISWLATMHMSPGDVHSTDVIRRPALAMAGKS